MAEIKVTENNEIVVPKSIIEARMDIKPVHMDMLAFALAEISKETDDDENLEYTLTTRQYCDLKGIADAKDGKKKILRDICGKGDQKNSIRHAGFEISKDENNFGTYAWFQDAEYKNGVLTLMMGSKAKKLLVELKKSDNYKVFALLKYILPMKSSYSKRIYLMCKQYITSGVIYPMDWEKFRWRMAVPTSYRDNMVVTRVLEKAKEEVNKYSDIIIDYKIDYIIGSGRSGKKANKISFTIQRKDTLTDKQKKAIEKKNGSSKNKFNNIEKQNYDMDALEEQLLSN